MQIIGGQALLDGVAIRSTRFRVAAKRRENGDIALASAAMERTKLLETPFVRGWILWFVASPNEMDWAIAEHETDTLPPSGTRSPLRVILALVIACAIPQLATTLLLHGSSAPTSLRFGLAMWAVFLVTALAYFLLVGWLFGALEQVYRYNAAFNMALWSANDADEPSRTTLPRHPTWHLQSSLLVMSLVVGAVSLVPALLPIPTLGTWTDHAIAVALRLGLLPITVMLIDELTRVLTRLGDGPLLRIAFAPLAIVNRLVTRTPTENELDVAAAALRELRRLEAQK